MQVKICGVCRAEDAELVVEAGADRIGVILAPGSPRTLTLGQARTVLEPAHSLVKVGVFVDAAPDEIVRAVEVLGLDVIQLHGRESAGDIAALGGVAGVWKAIRVREPQDLLRGAEAYAAADALLLDAWHPTQAGGTGTQLDWDRLVAHRERLPAELPIILAGGLTPGNVADAARQLRPDGVDVSSGVESAPGCKSAEKIHAFIAAARAVTAPRREE